MKKELAITIKAKDFAMEITNHNVIEKDLKSENLITKEHVDNNIAVRKMLHERGVKSEALPPAEETEIKSLQLFRNRH